MALPGRTDEKVLSILGNAHMPGLGPQTLMDCHVGPWWSRLRVGQNIPNGVFPLATETLNKPLLWLVTLRHVSVSCHTNQLAPEKKASVLTL